MTSKLTKEIKDWFGGGEQDVDLMLRMGVVQEEFILDLWRREVEVPKLVEDIYSIVSDAMKETNPLAVALFPGVVQLRMAVASKGAEKTSERKS